MLRLEVIINFIRTGIKHNSKGLYQCISHFVLLSGSCPAVCIKDKNARFRSQYRSVSKDKIMLIPYPLASIGTAVSRNSGQSPKIKTISKVFK